ncbi:RNA polymerase sigma factor SigB [Fredinandcohnia sp. 179-A 10B2 NHS]|uniref:RNA polymerase sigma factor SigB n=1 Tax=Fredinandcohnia sp. 179-A 10B2 NHS TaxID=3235176 RepID=UPI00399FFEB4
MKKQSTGQRNEEVERLIQKFQSTGSKEVEKRIIEKYQRLVESVAWKYSKGKIYHEDIVQTGMVGLLNAIRRFDGSVGKSFKSYAIPTIIGEIKHFLRDKTWSLHVPRRIKELGSKIKRAKEELIIELQRMPETHEIATYLNVEESAILEAMEMGQGYEAMSVDSMLEPNKDGKATTLYDVVGKKERGFDKVNRKIVLESMLDVLTDREKKVLHHTYLKERSQKETGKIVGISQMHVSRIQRTAIRKLQEAVMNR